MEISSKDSLQEAKQWMAQGDRTQAGRLIKQVLDRDFKDRAAWELLYQWFGGQRSFPEYQTLFVKKYFPNRLSKVPFCPRCQYRYPPETSFCGKCGYGLPQGNVSSAPIPQHISTETSGHQLNQAIHQKGKSKAPIWWSLGLGLMAFGCLFSAAGGAFDASEIFIWGFLSIWACSGYVGMVWLFKRGFMAELLGCMFLAGGAPLWFPVFFGPIILGIAYFLPQYPSYRGQ